MSLFPAYAPDGDGKSKTEGESDRNRQWNVEVLRSDAARDPVLTASDADSSYQRPATAAAGAASISAPHKDFYFDGKPDTANLGVTTLYIPGRPIYKRASGHPLGKTGGGGGGGGGRAARRRRYFSQQAQLSSASSALRVLGASEAAERARALRRLLDDSSQDEELWLRYIEFQEEWADGEAWRAACEAACAGGAGGARVRAALHNARRASLPPADLLRALSADLASGTCGAGVEAWLRLAWAVGGSADGAAGVQRAGVAALAALPREPRAYPLLLYVYGAALRAAGLWEQLVLLVELVCAVNYPPSATFPPPPPSQEETRERERRLQCAEDAVIGSGLPLSTVWVRVERLRSAAHWRPLAGAGAGAGAEDPQRAAAPADVQALVACARPPARLLLCVTLLRLAQVPLLPASEALHCACAAGPHDDADPPPVALAALHRAARRLSTTTTSSAAFSPAALRAALPQLLHPPHYFSDEAGYLTWVSALWEACCGWAEGDGRVALACWRLRWLHALVRAAPAGGAEARRLRAAARRVVKAHAPASAVACALFARIEAELGAAAAARRAALHAVRAASAEEALYAARVLRDLQAGAGAGAGEATARWALCAAATGLPLPPDDTLEDDPPPVQLQERALQECSKRCAELERRFQLEAEAGAEEEEVAVEEAVAGALSCGAGEWGAARVALLPAAERAALLTRLLQLGYTTVHRSAAALQYYEACACALVAAAAAGRGGGAAQRAHLARQLLTLFPHNALLALASRCEGVWTRALDVAAPRAPVCTLAALLPALCAASLPPSTDADPASPCPQPAPEAQWRRVARLAAGSAGGAAGSAALWAVRLQAEARLAAPHRLHRLLLAALHDHPNDKWLYVNGAAWVPAEAEALCDAALERSLRVHALPHELRPLEELHK